MIAEQNPAIGELSPQEKYILANELWEEISADENLIPFNDAVVALLEERHEEYLKDPTKVVTWEELKAKLGK